MDHMPENKPVFCKIKATQNKFFHAANEDFDWFISRLL